MAKTYAEFRDLVRSWANRDEEVLPNDRVQDFMQYAADRAYRTLRVPPLETTVRYDDADSLEAATTNANIIYGPITELAIPVDLIEFIHLRGIDADNLTTRMFNEKTDIRTFYDFQGEKQSIGFWSRHGNNILLAPGFGTGFSSNGNETGYELHYYRRLPALNATYQVTAANANAGLTTATDPTITGGSEGTLVEATYSGTPTDPDVVGLTTTYYPEGTTSAEIEAEQPTPAGQTLSIADVTHYGENVPNWLREENEKLVLFGALAEAFSYLQEDDQLGKYNELFLNEINELNTEDRMRNSSGGNVQVNFNGRGLI